MKQEKTGRIADIIFHNETNMYSILGFETEDEQFTAVGYMPRPQKGRSFRLLGDWVEHPRFGEQFAFSEFEEIQPTTEEGIESFLSSGVIKGVGASTARAIVRYFGKETLEVLSKPDLLTRVSGIGKKKAQAIAAAYAEHRLAAPVVQSHVDYFSPLLLDEVCVIRAELFWNDGARLDTAYTVTGGDGRLCATGFTVQMFCSLDTREPCLFPPAPVAAMRERWQKGEWHA